MVGGLHARMKRKEAIHLLYARPERVR